MASSIKDITELRQTEEELKQYKENLEALVEQRTEELERTNERLTREIEERRRAEAAKLALERKVHEAQKLESLGLLAGGIAHDFNNLLTGVLGNAELALADLAPESPAVARLKDIRDTAHRLAGLTHQMLAYSGKGRFLVEPLNLSRLVEEIAHLLEVSISKKVAIKYDLEADLSPIEADATQVRQVIMNLITNASEAIGDKSGVIALSTGALFADSKYLAEVLPQTNLAEGNYVYLEVSDTGCGMTKETIQKIFDPFFTTKFAGRGLGLAAVLGIVRGHGGGLKVYSEPKRGTTMKVLLPQSRQSGLIPAEQVQEGEELWTGEGTILVVDDEETVRKVAKMILETAGFRVLTAEDGQQAIKMLQEKAQEISAVVLDLTMPHMDGIETFNEMRGLGLGVPVILASGYNEQEATSRLAGKGLAGFLHKPFEISSLLKTVAKVLSLQD